MRTPYPELTIDVTQRLRDFAEWNLGIQRSRIEYAIHPFANCTHNGNCTKRYRRGLR